MGQRLSMYLCMDTVVLPLVVSFKPVSHEPLYNPQIDITENINDNSLPEVKRRMHCQHTMTLHSLLLCE